MKKWLKNWLKKIWKGMQDAAEAYHQMKLEEGCEYCGGLPICEDCYRCFNRDCNAGCIFCNPKPFKEVATCPCCGRPNGR